MRKAPTLGEIIRTTRQRRPMTQTVLARMVGISNAYLSDIERGARDARNMPTLQKLARALDLNADWLCTCAGLAPDHVAAKARREFNLESS